MSPPFSKLTDLRQYHGAINCHRGGGPSTTRALHCAAGCLQSWVLFKQCYHWAQLEIKYHVFRKTEHKEWCGLRSAEIVSLQWLLLKPLRQRSSSSKQIGWSNEQLWSESHIRAWVKHWWAGDTALPTCLVPCKPRYNMPRHHQVRVLGCHEISKQRIVYYQTAKTPFDLF